MCEIDVSKCEKCPFYDEFGAICNMYSCHETNYSITEWQDKCLYKQLQQLKQENEELKEEIKDRIKQRQLADDRYIKYQTKLEKIKEIANVIIGGNHITNDIEGQLTKVILQIIEEKTNEG